MTPTSSAHTLVLFVDPPGFPSELVKENLKLAMEGTDYAAYVAVLERKYHNALIVSFDIISYPTMLILDQYAQVIYREDMVRNLHEDRFRAILQTIHYNRKNPR